MIQLKKLQFQYQAIQNYKRRIEHLRPFKPLEAIRAAETAGRLEAKVRARWGVRFSAFLRQVNGRG